MFCKNKIRSTILSLHLITMLMGYFVTTSSQAGEPISPIPNSVDVDWHKATLGERLFHDGKLASDGRTSCATCHQINRGGVDGLPKSFGVEGRRGAINTSTVLNSSLNFVQFWDGRARTLEAQIEGPIHNPVEMATNWPDIIKRLSNDPDYIRTFKELYPDGIQASSIKDAIATYERTLLTPGGRFDQFLLGDKSAISEEERQGYQLFKNYGCSSCHQGAAAGGNMYEKLGIFNDYFLERGDIQTADYGRYNVTGIEEEKFEFKVPSLRNVAQTAPYLHDGSIQTLEEMVYIMGRYQLGRTIPKQDIGKIVAFLHTLSGKLMERQ